MAQIQNALTQVEGTLDEYFGRKAPQLPENIKEIIVKIAPYLTIVGIIFSVPAVLLLLGLTGVATLIAPMGGVPSVAAVPTMWLSGLLLLPVIILEAMAIPGLFARTRAGWQYVYWAQLVSIVSSLLSLNFFGAIIGGAIGFYLLFQVKSHYK